MHATGAIMGVGDGEPGISILAHPIELGSEGEGEGEVEAPHIDLWYNQSMKLTLYAPKYHVHIKGPGDFYGAVVGSSVHIQGSQFHYDEALAYDAGLSTVSEYAKISWRELGLP